MADVHFIVSKLNAPPFSLGISLIAFSEKQPQELLLFLSDLFAKFVPKMLQKDAGLESPEQTADRLAGLLRMVKYQPNMDGAEFRQLLAAGDRDVVYSVIKWVLSQGHLLEKKAFVGFYLSFPEMPEELLYDPQVIELREEIRGLQGEFVASHKALDAAQAHVKELPQLRAQIKQMEDEKERLNDKVQKAAAQAAVLPDAANYRDVCVALRQEHDREVAISQQLVAQQQQLDRAEAALHRSNARLREMQQQQVQQHGSSGAGALTEAGADIDGSKLLEMLRDDVARLRQQVSSHWPKELEAKQSRLAAVQATLNNGINTEGDLQRLLSQETGLRQQVAAVQERIASLERTRASDKAFLQVRQAQQMSSLVMRKKAELAAKVQRLQERHSALAAALDAREASQQGQAGGAQGGVVTEAEWRAKYDAVKAQLPAYRAMKQELEALEGEVRVLQETEEILRAQDTSGAVPRSDTHATQGLSVDSALGQAAAASDFQDGDPAALLGQVSAAIKQRKAQLAPSIQELRSLRQQQQELEAVHAEKKAIYDGAVGCLEGAVSKLQGSVTELQQGVEAAGSELDKTRTRVQELERHLQQIQTAGAEETKRRAQAHLQETEAALSKLREQQRHAEERSSHGQAQLGMMSDLLQLLQLKQHLVTAAAAAAAAAISPSNKGAASAGGGGQDATLLSTGRWAPAVGAGAGANVMVL